MYDSETREQLESYLTIHLKNDQLELSDEEQLEALQKRGRAKNWHLIFNIAAVLFFGYSFYYGITQLSETFLIAILAVFGVNVGLIFYQKKQINELIEYLRWKVSKR